MKTINAKKKGKSVLWAIDPFEVEQFKAQEDAIRALDAVFDPQSTVQPVFVWGGRPMGDAKRPLEISRQADLILGSWPKPPHGTKIRGLKVIVAPGTTSARARALSDYSKRHRYDLILTSHHTRSGLKRAFMGSFSESLSLVAETPFMIVPPGAKSLSTNNSILFPTDFSDASMKAFEEVLHLAAINDSGLTLFHKIEQTVQYPLEFGYGYSSEAMESLVKDAESSLSRMKDRARQIGVEVRAQLDQRPGHAGLAILSEAKKGYGLIAMAAHKGFWGRVVMGSTSRFVLRECPTAIWMLRPKSAGRSARGDRAKKNRSKTAQASGAYLV